MVVPSRTGYFTSNKGAPIGFDIPLDPPSIGPYMEKSPDLNRNLAVTFFVRVHKRDFMRDAGILSGSGARTAMPFWLC